MSAQPPHTTAKPITRVVAGIIRHDGRILICQRGPAQRHPLRWEFPGGKCEPGESEPEALARELGEELGLAVSPAQIGRLLLRRRHRYPETGVLELAFYEVLELAGAPQNRVFAAIRWERPAALADYDFLEADRPLFKLLE